MCKHCGKHPDVITCTGKKKVLFVFDIPNTTHWKDGLWAALLLLEKEFDISYWNLALIQNFPCSLDHFDFILGWSSFDGEIAYLMRNLKVPHGLCIGGYMFEPHKIDHFDVLFYETEWYGEAELKHRHKNARHAFGVNTDIFFDKDSMMFTTPKIIDYLTIGSFSTWKRQQYLLKKEGVRLAIGQIQQNNLDESFGIISELMAYGCGVMGECAPETLADFIRASKNVYLPATITGGSERSVLESRACGVPVEVEEDNPKLQELLTSPIWDQHYYAEKLKEGILSVIA